MLKRMLSILLIVTLVVVSVGCGAKETGSGNSSEDPIKIGYIGALSGETALWGQAGLNGMIMAQNEINEAGGILGRTVKVVEYDGKGEPLDSINAFNKLVDQDKVIAVVGTNFSSINIPMATIAGEKEIPVLATAASSPQVTVDENGNLHPYSFRIGFTDPFQGRVLAAYSINELKLTKAAILTNIADSYSTGITEYLVDEYTKLGGTIVANEQASSGDNDFRAQLSNIKNSEAEVIFIPWIYKDVSLIVKQARDLGIEAVFMGADGWDSQDLPTLAGEAIEGSYFCSRIGFNTPDAKEFQERYEAEYKITAEAEGLFGYDGLMWLKQVIEEGGTADSQTIRDGLENTTNFKGTLGTMSVDPTTHDPVREAAIFQISNGTNNFIEAYSPAE